MKPITTAILFCMMRLCCYSQQTQNAGDGSNQSSVNHVTGNVTVNQIAIQNGKYMLFGTPNLQKVAFARRRSFIEQTYGTPAVERALLTEQTKLAKNLLYARYKGENCDVQIIYNSEDTIECFVIRGNTPDFRFKPDGWDFTIGISTYEQIVEDFGREKDFDEIVEGYRLSKNYVAGCAYKYYGSVQFALFSGGIDDIEKYSAAAAIPMTRKPNIFCMVREIVFLTPTEIAAKNKKDSKEAKKTQDWEKLGHSFDLLEAAGKKLVCELVASPPEFFEAELPPPQVPRSAKK